MGSFGRWKRYDQYCPIAHSLGLVGERWTLLVVRELMHGPKRYTDLVDGLPGIGTNILAARLKALEAAGLVDTTQAAAACGLDRLRVDTDRPAASPGAARARTVRREADGPPPAEALDPGWLVERSTSRSRRSRRVGRLAFRIGDEEALLVDGVARPGSSTIPMSSSRATRSASTTSSSTARSRVSGSTATSRRSSG